jgi:hypothetical protein
MLAMDDPKFLVLGEMPDDRETWGIVDGDALPLDPDRWAEERQYLRNDPELQWPPSAGGAKRHSACSGS